MNWKKEAESELRSYSQMKNLIIKSKGLYDQIDQNMTGVRGARVGRKPIEKGTCAREARTDSISKNKELESMSLIAAKQLELVDRGLSALTDEEQKILRYFYIDRPKNFIDRLCDELGYEQSSLYYHKEIALRKYTLASYGLIDT